MTKQTSLMRTCIACGIEKPLAAYLQITGAQGTTYGNVCSTCRGATAKTRTTIFLDENERGGGSSGIRIGTDARNQAEILEVKDKKEKKEAAREELLEKFSKEDDKKFRDEIKYKEEKDHRKFLESKRFLRFHETEKKGKTFLDAKVNIEKHGEIIENINKAESIQQDIRTNSTDLSVPFLDPQFTLIKFHSPIFLEFKRWLGSSAPIMRTFEQLFKKQEALLKQTQDQKIELKTEKDPLIEYAEKAWGPSRKR